jgi:hypothetical protein
MERSCGAGRAEDCTIVRFIASKAKGLSSSLHPTPAASVAFVEAHAGASQKNANDHGGAS